MDAVEYQAWARHIDRFSGDFSTQQVIASIGKNHAVANGAKSVKQSDFIRWQRLEEPDEEKTVFDGLVFTG